MKLRRVIVGAVVVALTAIGMQWITAVAASADVGVQVQNAFQCQDDGTFKVVWTIDNDSSSLGGTVSIQEYTPAAASVSPSTLNLDPSGSGIITESGIPGASISALLLIEVQWSDSSSRIVDNQVILPGDCNPPVTPQDPTVTQPGCTPGSSTSTAPTVVPAVTTGITYSTSPSAPYVGGQLVSVTATAQSGYSFVSPGPAGWTYVDSTHENYGIAFSQVVCTVAQTINFALPSTANVGDTITLSATGGASGQPILFAADPSTTNSACSIQGGTLSIDHVGSCVVDANQAGLGSYDTAPQVSQSVLVSPGVQTIGFTASPPTNAIAGGPDYTPSVSGSAGGTDIVITLGLSSTGCALTDGVVKFIGAGPCVVVANRPSDSDYSASPTATVQFPVAAGVVTFTTTRLPNAIVGQPYSFVLHATGGIAPYTWTATGLPDGLSLDPTTGALTGTPTDAGQATITVTVTDSEDPVTDTLAFRLTTDPASTLPTTGVAVASPLTVALLLVLIGSAMFFLRGRRRNSPRLGSSLLPRR